MVHVQFCIPLHSESISSMTVLIDDCSVALRRVNSDSVNYSGRERFCKAHAVRSAIEMDKYNTIGQRR